LSQSLAEVRLAAGSPSPVEPFSLAAFVADARNAASLYASASDCGFVVPAVDPLLGVMGDRELLLAALINLLQNAFKFTHPHTAVTLKAYAEDDRVLIDVVDHCGGLPAGAVELMFKPFVQAGNNRNGLGLGLSIAKRSVESSGGTLNVRDVPGTGCVFTIGLPRQVLQ
jgi:signal transduction histidine kinase